MSGSSATGHSGSEPATNVISLCFCVRIECRRSRRPRGWSVRPCAKPRFSPLRRPVTRDRIHGSLQQSAAGAPSGWILLLGPVECMRGISMIYSSAAGACSGSSCHVFCVVPYGLGWGGGQVQFFISGGVQVLGVLSAFNDKGLGGRGVVDSGEGQCVLPRRRVPRC